MRLKVTSQAVEYYLDTGRVLPAAGIVWTNHLGNFHAEKESLDETKENTGSSELLLVISVIS